MSLSDDQWVFTQNTAKLIIYAEGDDFKLTLGEVWRHKLLQEHYLVTGKSTVEHSYHLDRKAVDFNIFIKVFSMPPAIGYEWKLIDQSDFTRVQVLGEFWESLHPNNMWGGFYPRHFHGLETSSPEYFKKFVDMPHYEMRNKPRKDYIRS